MDRQRRCRAFGAGGASQLRVADGIGRQLARHQGQTVRASTGGGARVSQHQGVPVGGERVLQLAGHRGRPTDRVRRVTHAEFLVRETECSGAAGLGEQREIS